MAESEPIKDSELIQPNVFKNSIESAEQFLVAINNLIKGFKDISAESAKTIRGTPVNTVANLEKIHAANQRILATDKASEELHKRKVATEQTLSALRIKEAKEKADIKRQLNKEAEARRASNKAIVDEEKAKKAADVAAKAYQRTQKNEIRLKTAAKGSIVALRAELSIITKKYNELSAAERNNIKVGKPLLAQQRALTNELNRLEQAGGNFRRQVGNYGVGFSKIGKGIKGLTGLLSELGHAFGIHTEALEKFVGIGSAINHTLKDINNAQKLQKVAAVENTAAINAQTTATELNSAAVEANTVAAEANVATAEAGVAATEAQAIATGEVATASGVLAGAEEAQALAAQEATIAQEELNAAMYKNPIGIIILAILALGGALYGLNSYLTRASEETHNLEKEYEELKITTDLLAAATEAYVKIGEAELRLMIAQGGSLEEIRKKQDAINALKEQELIRNRALIKMSVALNKQKLNDIKVNDSINESLVRGAAVVARAFGQKEEADRLDAALDAMKKGRSEDLLKTNEENLKSQMEADAAYIEFMIDKQTLAAERDNEDEDLAKKATERIKEHNAKREKLYIEDRDAKIQAEREKLEELLRLRERLEQLEEGIAPDKTEEQEEQERYEAQLKELNDIADASKEAGYFDQERYDKDLELLERKHMENLAKILDEGLLEQGEQVEEDNKKRIKSSEEVKEAMLEDLREITERAEQMNEAITNAIDKRFEAQEKGLEEESEGIEDELSRQEQRFRDGLDNTYSYQQDKQRENDIKMEELEEKKEAAEHRRRLAEIFLAFSKGYAENGDMDANRKALTQALIAEGISNAIAGNFAEGIENFKGKGTGTSDSNLIGFSAGESVTTAKGTRETPGLVSAVNEDGFAGAARWAMENVYAPQFVGAMPEDSIRASAPTSDWLGSAVLNQLVNIEKKFDKIKSTELTANSLGEITERISRDGITKVITHKRPKW